MKSMELIENEKSEIKRNNSNYILKYNNMEKEIKSLNEKNKILTNNIKNLIEKNNNQKSDFNFQIKKHLNKIDDLENKIISLENKNKEINKDVIYTFIKNIINNEKNNIIKFKYIPNSNKIQLIYLNEFLAEVDNEKNEINIENKLSPFKNNNKNITTIKKHPLNSKDKESYMKYKQITYKNKYYNSNYNYYDNSISSKDSITLYSGFVN